MPVIDNTKFNSKIYRKSHKFTQIPIKLMSVPYSLLFTYEAMFCFFFVIEKNTPCDHS